MGEQGRRRQWEVGEDEEDIVRWEAMARMKRSQAMAGWTKRRQ